MAVLSAQTIRKLGLVSPFREKYQWTKPETVTHFKIPNLSGGLSACGYDIAVADSLYLDPGDFTLSVSVEKFHIPTNIVGRTANKSTWIRKGLLVPYTILEPGWTGYLTLEFKNLSHEAIFVPHGAPILQVTFEELDEPTEQGYGPNGKYQNQPNVPVQAK
jgi:dCTP deaminase